MRTHLVLGLPASGKSTYIAALGHILLRQDVETELRLEISEDESHILALQERWLKYEVLKHTPTNAENWITFHLISNHSHESLNLELPDFSGESLKNAIATGIYPAELAAALMESEAIFLFTNAAGRQDDILLNDLYGLVQPEVAHSAEPDGQAELASAGSTTVHSRSAAHELSKNAVFDPTAMPEEPKLVQLLQTISELARKKRKLVVMVSAWDVVHRGNPETQPVDWLRDNKPMLWQFLNHSPSIWETRVYGVSAQGGRIPEDTEALKRVSKASKRVRIVGYEAKLHDLTAPLAWLARK
jgi:hypothetical protein